jgi:hypothetical protein
VSQAIVKHETIARITVTHKGTPAQACDLHPISPQ